MLDSELLQGCKKGERLAQKNLYERYYGRMMTVCLRYASGREEAVEILNKGFLKVFKSVEIYNPEFGRLDSWIYKIMMNTAIDHYRSEFKHRHNVVDIDHAHYVEDQSDVIPNISAEEIIKIVQQLTPAYRTVFNLYVMEGLNHNEIAEKLEISVGSSKSNLSKARKKLQLMLSKNEKINLMSYAR